MSNISKHITYKEATFSITAIRKGYDNTPSEAVISRMKAVAGFLFEPLRTGLGGHKIRVSSFYRSPKVNKAVGGAKYSSHMYGNAIDLVAYEDTPITNAQIFYYTLHHLCFDQLIWEHGDKDEPAWVHISFKSDSKNRNEVLRAFSKNGKTHYTDFKIK